MLSSTEVDDGDDELVDSPDEAVIDQQRLADRKRRPDASALEPRGR